MMRTGRPFRLLVVSTLVALMALVTLGGVVRVTGSGLGCPDWPLCHGRIIPPIEFHTLLEYSHRLVASLVSVLVVLLAVVAWRRYRRNRWVVVPVTLALGVLGVEVVLGGITVLTELDSLSVTLHLGVAQAIFALLLVTLVWSWQSPAEGEARQHSGLTWWALGAALATFLVLLSGSDMVGRGAGAACPNWPLCDGGLFPSSQYPWIHMIHRILAGGVGLLVAGVALRGWRERKSSGALGWASAAVGAALVAQVLTGAANPWFNFVAPARVLHLSLATTLWGSLVLLTVLAWRPGVTASESPASLKEHVHSRRPLTGVIVDYIVLTKPRIILLLLLTALGGMFLAAQGPPPLSLALLVMGGGALGAAGASALNHYLERDIDEQMSRTRQRPVAGHRIQPWQALTFGILLNVLAFLILTTWVNLLSALLTLSATLFYVFVYTSWLKRSTPQNIVIGGASGAVPPLVGWAAVTGGLDLPAFYLFAIIFFWTPPHFWALSLLLRKDYAKAGIPMLPVVSGVRATAQSIALHTVVLVAITILFYTVQAVGLLYLTGAVVLGTLFLLLAWRLLRTGGVRGARSLYLYSLMYLAALFAIVMVDSAVKL